MTYCQWIMTNTVEDDCITRYGKSEKQEIAKTGYACPVLSKAASCSKA